MAALEKALTFGTSTLGASAYELNLLMREIKKNQEKKEAAKKPNENYTYLKDYKTQYSLQNEKWELLVPNSQLEELPPVLSVTLHL